jgi:hypothetical protein
MSTEPFPAETFSPTGSESILATEGEIPLPLPEMWGDLDNSRPVEPASISARSERRKPGATLAFTGGKAWSKVVPLDFPFEYEGRTVAEITVRRLTTAEMGEVASRHGDELDQWDIFAVMTGLPAAVLRGLEAGDGDEVTGVAYDFLPRTVKTGG